MKTAVNIRDVARQAGVSVATVSRALNEAPGSKKISAKTREHILAICDDLQYQPNVHTVRMLSGRANTIALLIPPDSLHVPEQRGSMDVNLAAVISGAEQEFARHRIYLTLASTSKTFLSSKEYLKLYRGKQVDGVIIWGWTDDQSYLHDMINDGMPVVLIQCGTDDLPVSQVIANDCAGMRAIIDHLVELGHRQIALIPPLTGGSSGRERCRGLYDGLDRHGLDLVYASQIAGFDVTTGYDGAMEILAEAPTATAIVAANDFAAVGAIKALRERGLRVPQDMSVTGADGINLYGYLELTTYISPAFAIGAAGARKMIQRLTEGPDAECSGSEVIDVQFVAGETTAAPR